MAYLKDHFHDATQESKDIKNSTAIADVENMILLTGRGDHAAFSALYFATSEKLFSVCFRIVNNRAEAEDTLQDVFVKIWKNAYLYRVTGCSPMTWLITVARNLAISRVRIRMRQVSTVTIDAKHDIADVKPTPEMIAVQKSQRAKIEMSLDNLDPANADAVRSAYIEGVSYQELADRAGIPINTVRTRLRRSLLKMRSELIKYQ